MQVPILTQALEKGLTVAEDSNRDNSVLHVTDLAVTIGEGCPRQLWLRLKGADKRKLSAGQMLMFWHGKRIHEDLTALLKLGLPGEWKIVGVEVPMEFDGIVGTADCVIKNAVTHEVIVVDYKTQRGGSFGYLNSTGEAKPAHVLQVQGYCYGLDFPQCDPSGGLVLYVDREGQNSFVQYPVMRNDARVKDAIEDAWAIANMKQSPSEFSPIVKYGKETKTKGIPVSLSEEWFCSYCDYQDISCGGGLPIEYRPLSGKMGAHYNDGVLTPHKDKEKNQVYPDSAIELMERLLMEEATAIPF